MSVVVVKVKDTAFGSTIGAELSNGGGAGDPFCRIELDDQYHDTIGCLEISPKAACKLGRNLLAWGRRFGGETRGCGERTGSEAEDARGD